MKPSFYALTTALVVAAVAPPALSAASKDEAAIRQTCDAFVAGWNSHDAKAMAATFAEDGDLINPFGAQAQGRVGIETFFAEEQAKAMGGTTYSIKENKVRILSSTLATSDWSSAVTGLKDPSGAELPPFVHHVFVVLEKKHGQWLAKDVRAFAFVPPPGAPPHP